jgi:hypothetical protein
MEKYPNMIVPPLLSKCITHIQAKGLETEGLYRIPGPEKETENLKFGLEANPEDELDDKTNIHAVASMVKIFLRELPQPLFLFPIRDRIELSGN